MKLSRLVFCLIVMLFTNTAWSDTVIQMEKYGGVYRIPCTVNGAKMKFIFDTGASNVCLSMSMAEYLYDNEFISKEDILGTGSSSVADGRIVDHVIINIKDIDIAGNHLHNVQAVVIDGQNAPLLMGQSAIKQLGNISLNDNILTIHNGYNQESYTDEEVQNLITQAICYSDKQLDWKAAEIYSDLYEKNLLSDYGKYLYGESLFYSEESERAITILEDIRDFSYFEEIDINPYYTLASCYSNIKDYKTAIRKLKESQAIFQLSLKNLGLSNSALTVNYALIDRYDLAIQAAWEAFSNFASMYNTDSNTLWNYCLGKNNLLSIDKTGWLDDLVNNVVRANYLGEEWNYDTMQNTRKRLASQGFPSAISYCKKNGLNY